MVRGLNQVEYDVVVQGVLLKFINIYDSVLRELTLNNLIRVVTIALRSHLFPSRTQKLSSVTPKVVGGSPPARIGSCDAILDV